MKSEHAKCSVPECENKRVGKGFCPKHYTRLRKYGDPHKVHPSPRNLKYIGCRVPGCDLKHDSKGFCQDHYYRWKKYGDPNATYLPKNIRCSVQGCDDKHHGKGLCRKHYERWKRHGDPNITKRIVGMPGDEYARLLRGLRGATQAHLRVYYRQQRGEADLQAELLRTLQDLESAYRLVWLWPMD